MNIVKYEGYSRNPENKFPCGRPVDVLCRGCDPHHCSEFPKGASTRISDFINIMEETNEPTESTDFALF